MVTTMLEDSKIYLYALLIPDATLSFMAPYVSLKFDLPHHVLLDTFSISTSVGDSVFVERVYRRFNVSLLYRVTLVNLVELDMLRFDVILGMNW